VLGAGDKGLRVEEGEVANGEAAQMAERELWHASVHVDSTDFHNLHAIWRLCGTFPIEIGDFFLASRALSITVTAIINHPSSTVNPKHISGRPVKGSLLWSSSITQRSHVRRIRFCLMTRGVDRHIAPMEERALCPHCSMGIYVH
jgi:hypothetical protein